MSATTTVNLTATLRNYALAAAAIALASTTLTDISASPNRAGQQGRIDSFSNVLSAGLVAQAQNLGR